MTGALLAGLATAGCVLAMLRRPTHPDRLLSLRTSRSHDDPFTRVGRRATVAIDRVPALRRHHLEAHVSDRSLGMMVSVTGVLAPLDPVLAIGWVAATALSLWWRGRRRAHPGTVPERAVIDDLPDVVDLLVLAVGAGLTVPAALPVVARSAPRSSRDALTRAATAISEGLPVDHVIAGLSTDWGDPAAPLVHALADHLRYGTPIGPTLERVAIDCRLRRRRAAETRARKVPVLLLFPLVLCTLPAFGLLTVAPLVAGTLGSLQLSPLEAPASANP